MTVQTDLFGTCALPGLSAEPNLVDPVEEAGLIACIDGADLTPFAFQGWTGRRLTPSFRAALGLLTTTELHDSSDLFLTHHGVLAKGRVHPTGDLTALERVVDLIDTGFPMII